MHNTPTNRAAPSTRLSGLSPRASIRRRRKTPRQRICSCSDWTRMPQGSRRLMRRRRLRLHSSPDPRLRLSGPWESFWLSRCRILWRIFSRALSWWWRRMGGFYTGYSERGYQYAWFKAVNRSWSGSRMSCLHSFQCCIFIVQCRILTLFSQGV